MKHGDMAPVATAGVAGGEGGARRGPGAWAAAAKCFGRGMIWCGVIYHNPTNNHKEHNSRRNGYMYIYIYTYYVQAV